MQNMSNIGHYTRDFLLTIDYKKWELKKAQSVICAKIRMTAMHICSFTVKNQENSGQMSKDG